MKARLMVVVLSSLAVCGVLLSEVWLWHGGLVRLPLPLARGEGFPFPLLYWFSIAMYANSCGRLFGLSREERWAGAIRLGFGMHMLALLANLAWLLTRDGRGVALSAWYLRAFILMWGTVLALGVAWCGSTRARWVRAGTTDSQQFFLPLLVSYLVFWMHSAWLNPWVTACATGMGLALIARPFCMVQMKWASLRARLTDERWFLAVAFLVALALRLFYTTRVMSNPEFLLTGSDGNAYDALAWAMVQGQTDGRWRATLFAPGYVRFVALIYGVFGRSYLAVCVAQSIIGALACLLLYAVAKRLFGSTVARIAAAFGAVNFLMVFAAAAIGHQALDLFWTLLVVWCLVRYTQAPQRWGRWMPGVGLLLGWATLTREGNGVFWLFLLGWFLLGVRVRVGWRRALLHVTGLSLGFLVLVMPFSSGGIQGRLSEHWLYLEPSMYDWFNPWRNSSAAWTLLRDHPLEVLMRVSEAVLTNFNVVFFNQDFGSFDPVFLVRRSSYFYGMWGYAYLLAVIGLVLVGTQALRRPIERLGWWLVIGLLVSRAAVHLFFQAAYRYRAPLEPYLIMLASYGLVRVLAIGRPSPRLDPNVPSHA